MTVRRTPIPLSIEQELLFRAHHICCICCAPGKDVQIHHIDGRPTNNELENLAVLCLDCHSRTTGTRGLGKAYTAGEVRKYKRSWEQRVLASRRVQRPVLRYQKEMISQIDLMICDILASEKDISRVKRLLGILYELHLWRGNREIGEKIIEGLHHLAVMTGIGAPKVAELVGEKLWEMCWQYVGPDEVPLDKRGKEEVHGCLDALSTLAHLNGLLGRGKQVTDEICRVAEQFFQVGLWYSRKRISSRVIEIYDVGLKACMPSKGERSFPYGHRKLLRSLGRVRRMLVERQPRWLAQRAAIDRVCGMATQPVREQAKKAKRRRAQP